MFLDKYTPADHDLYSYEFDTNDETAWAPFDYNYLDEYGNTVKINRPTGYNTNCLLKAFGTDSPPWHKISVSDRRLNFLGTNYISDDSVKDRYIKNSFSTWRTASNSTELHLANKWNSGSVHFIPISDKLMLCSRTALEDAITRPDITMKRYDTGDSSSPGSPAPQAPDVQAPGYYHRGGNDAIRGFIGWAGNDTEFQGGEDFLFDVSPNIRFLDNFGNYATFDLTSQNQVFRQVAEGGFSPPLKDMSFPKAYVGCLLGAEMYYYDNAQDNSKLPKDLMLLNVQSTIETIPDELKIKWCVTEQQLLDNSYYDGTHFYSPVLYGLDDNGRLFKVRRRYWASSATNKPTVDDVVNSPAEYVEVDDAFGKPLGVWRGSSSSPMFVKSIIENNTEWAIYGMSTAGASFTEAILEGMRACRDATTSPLLTYSLEYTGFEVQQVPADSLNDVRDLISVTSSSTTITRGIGHKMGVRYDGVDDSNGTQLGPIDIVTTDLVKDTPDPSSLDAYEKVPPTLIDESLSIEFVYDKINSGYNYDYSQPPYSLRAFGADNTEETTLSGLISLNTPHMIKLNVDQSTSNINNPSEAPYTAEIEWYRVEDGQHFRFDSSDSFLNDVAKNNQSIGRGQFRQRDYLSQSPQTSTTALTPAVGLATQYSAAEGQPKDFFIYIPKSSYNLGYKTKNLQILEEQGNPATVYTTIKQPILSNGKIANIEPIQYQFSNNYIQPTGDIGLILQANQSDFEYYPHYKEHKITDSFFLDELSNFRDTTMASYGRVDAPGTKIKCVFSLINEYGKSSYEVTDERFFDFIHQQDLRDEFYRPGQPVAGQHYVEETGELLMLAFIQGSSERENGDRIIQAGQDYKLKLETRGTSWSGHPRRYLKQTLVFEDGTEVETDWTDEHEPLGSDGEFTRYVLFTAPTVSGEGTYLSHVRITMDEVAGDIGSDRRVTFDTPKIKTGGGGFFVIEPT